MSDEKPVSTEELIERVTTLGKVQIPLSIAQSRQVVDRLQSQRGKLEKAYNIIRQTQVLLKHKDTTCNCDGCSWIKDYETEMEPKE